MPARCGPRRAILICQRVKVQQLPSRRHWTPRRWARAAMSSLSPPKLTGQSLTPGEEKSHPAPSESVTCLLAAVDISTH
eukprot:5016084-Amphidinium_carterae.1